MTETSACHSILTVGIQETTTDNLFSIRPNPTDGNIFLHLQKEIQSGVLRVLDPEGRRVYEMMGMDGKEFSLDLRFLQPGIYFIELNTIKEKMVSRMVKW